MRTVSVPAGSRLTVPVFDPTAPGSPSTVTVDPGLSLNSVACPSSTQCTGVDGGGQEVTFNPISPGIPSPATVDGTNTLNGVACPSTTQCTAVDSTGQAVTFNPAAPGRSKRIESA